MKSIGCTALFIVIFCGLNYAIRRDFAETLLIGAAAFLGAFVKSVSVRKRSRILICMRQEDTWTWPEELGARTEGVCEKCRAPIYYEAQNKNFRKICQVCATASSNRNSEGPPP